MKSSTLKFEMAVERAIWMKLLRGNHEKKKEWKNRSWFDAKSHEEDMIWQSFEISYRWKIFFFFWGGSWRSDVACFLADGGLMWCLSGTLSREQHESKPS